jgi:hypothetical protein
LRNILVIILLLGFVRAQSETFNPEDYRNREVTAIRLDQPLEIDGILDESLYSTTANDHLIQFQPNNGVLGSEKTEFWIGYDDNALYIGAMMYDSNPDSIIARMSRRDGGETSDMLYIAIDSYLDKRSGFMFGINPVGSISDFTLSNDGNVDDAWDGIWDGQGRINENGWSTEIRVPFSQLRFNKADENIMGIGLGRRIQRRNEMDFFTYISREESGIVSHFAILKGIKNIQPPKRLEMTPYINGNHGILKTEDENPFYNGKNSDINIGTDLKIGIGNNLTVNATINPDFGQVEVDPSELNLSAFEIRYREKRPFFIEGRSIFGFGTGGPTNHMSFGTMEPTFFYSRRIGKYPSYGYDVEGDWVKVPSSTSILGATKLSGKITDTWSVGSFSAITKREFANVQIDGENSEVEVEPLTSYNLFRTLKEFNQGRQGLGVIMTYVDRNFEDEFLRGILSDQSTVLGIDGWTFLNQEKDWVIGGFFGYSNVVGSKDYIYDLQQTSARYFQRPDADHIDLDPDRTSLEGFAGKATINKETGKWNFNSAIQFISPGFENNDMGLNFRADNINKHISFGYKWLEPGEIFQTISLNTAYMTNHNFAGDKLSEMMFFMGFARFSNFWMANVIAGIGPRTLSDQALRGGPLVTSPASMSSHAFVRTDSRKPIIFELGGNYEQSEKGSYSFRMSPEIELNLGTRLRLEFEPGYSKQIQIAQYIDSFDDDTAINMLGCRHIVAQMDRKTVSAEFRIDYTFTPKLSFQAYFQPYMTVGSYLRFKEFVKPESYDFVEYGKDGGIEITKDGDDGYELYPNGIDGNSFYIDNPDFNYKALVGSAVLRWEFRPGSTLYLVWTRNGTDTQNPGIFNFNRDIKDLFRADADNVFALKVTYWFGK